MRTTIEIKPEHRAELLELAASRGEKGFSSVIAEALDFYLQSQARRSHAIVRALQLKGSLGASEASALRDRTAKIREEWR